MSVWQWWVIAGIVLLTAEIFTAGFLAACLGLACLIVGASAFLGLDFHWQIVFFCLANLGIFLFIRPFFLKCLAPDKPELRTNADALIGKIGLVTQAVDPKNLTGRVNVGGEDWRAVSSKDEAINVGEKIAVKKVDGTKLIVERA
ncbi:MAG: NfeD family protein [Candidatus Omnitrophica bacterium]|nr:NfeD family protein [Candidatus Omnitrophota bacterium]